jgi:DNA-nicking Smr family endonuclease
MKSRHPTPEERKLWRQSNRFTSRKAGTVNEGEDEVEIAPETAPSSKSAAAIPDIPAAKKQPKAALTPLSSREATRNFKLYPIGATLDLHGFTKLEAYAKVASFITFQRRQGHRHVLIITGKGRGAEVGVLRANLPDWLNEPALRPLISAMAHGRPEKGGTGVLHVLLKA